MTSQLDDVNEFSSELGNLIDLKFGSDLESLSKISQVYQEVLKKKDDLEKEMKVPDDATTDDVDEGSQYKQGVVSMLAQLERCRNVDGRRCETMTQVQHLLDSSADTCQRFLSCNEEIENLRRYQLYMRYVAKINETSENVQQSILSDSMTDACLSFKRLVTYHGCLIDKSTKCTNIVNHLHTTIMFWYQILKNKLTKELDDILKLVNWPFLKMSGPDRISLPPSLPSGGVDQPIRSPVKVVVHPQRRLEIVIGNLLNVQLPKHVRSGGRKIKKENTKPDEEVSGDNNTTSSAGDTEKSDDSLILLPFQLMLRPLRKRFHYHFSGNKETNKFEKPEWYLTQVANWIEYHSKFLENTIQPILDKHKHQYVDALVMFSQGLLQLVTCKLAVDIDTILTSDDIFSHLVDEVLIFDRDLRNLHDIPASLLKLHSPLNILALPRCIDKWLHIEKAWANEKLENLLSEEDSWKPKLASLSHLEDDPDESKVPQCAESVVNMLLTVTDRYKNLPSWEEKLRFLDFQLSILDDFRLRITQVIRSISTSVDNDQTFAIINTAHYITTVLGDLNNNLFYLEMKHHKQKITQQQVIPPSLISLTQPSNQNMGDATTSVNADETLFDQTVLLYCKIYEDATELILHQTLTNLKTKSYPYITDSWSTMDEPNEQVQLVVSRTICPLLSELQLCLMTLEQKMTSFLFKKLWKQLADQLDVFLFHEVVVKNSFNTGGAAQLQFDMKENLFPIFRSLTKRPESYFKRVKEACLLLNLQTGSAMLLKETVTEDEVGAKKILNEMGIYLILPKDAITLLERRVDFIDPTSV